MTSASAFAPASVSNVACGFDILGFAVEGPGDLVTATAVDRPGVTIESNDGDDGRLPKEPALNTAGIAAQAVLEQVREKAPGVTLHIDKQMPLSSGLGSSAASAVAAAVATNAALEGGLTQEEIFLCALKGETFASGTVHGDNVAPSFYGRLVLVRSTEPPDIIRLPVPKGLSCAVLRPRIEVRTPESRALLGEAIALPSAVRQWANVAGLIAALYREDFDLLERSLVDVIAEPVRGPGIPGFFEVKEAALESGALGCSLSGSGPAIFALCRTPEEAEVTARAMQESFQLHVGIDSQTFTTPVGAEGARIIPSA
jgi:homoserine kinase